MKYFEYLSNISEKAVIGKDCIIHAGVHIHDDVVIGNRVKIQAQVFIPNGVRIEDDVFIGPQVCFTNDRDLDDEFEVKKTIIKKGAKIGANSTIIAGVTIAGVVGAGSVVTKDIPAGELWVSNPAKFLRKI